MLKIADDVLPDPVGYMMDARRLKFRDFTFGPDTFRGIAHCHRKDVADVASLMAGAAPALSFFRRSPEGQAEPNYIHSDESMGRYTAIYYMNPEPADGDGTAFWAADGKRADMVPAKFNRLLVFDSSLLHSRAIFNNYGEGDLARLIQVVFLK